MPTRIAFSTHYPARMKDLAGKPTRFPEKIIAGIDIKEWVRGHWKFDMSEAGYINPIKKLVEVANTPKTTTIRSNYEYWKSKEGQLIQPFFWAGKPYRSKQVVFCPEVRLKRVSRINIMPDPNRCGGREVFTCVEKNTIDHPCDIVLPESVSDIELFIQNEGFDHPDHFWMWFDRDFSGAYLELESAKQ